MNYEGYRQPDNAIDLAPIYQISNRDGIFRHLITQESLESVPRIDNGTGGWSLNRRFYINVDPNSLQAYLLDVRLETVTPISLEKPEASFQHIYLTIFVSPTGTTIAGIGSYFNDQGNFDAAQYFYLWNSKNGHLQQMHQIVGVDRMEYAIAKPLAYYPVWSPDEHIIALARADWTGVDILDVFEQSIVQQLRFRQQDQLVGSNLALGGVSSAGETNYTTPPNITFSQDGDYLIGGAGKGIYIWNTTDWGLVQVLQTEGVGNRIVQISPDGTALLIDSWLDRSKSFSGLYFLPDFISR